ncbi:hypothetical protein [Streptomyces colonosanans]|uniref:Integrase SAM-like N-terminal domain-containing protein n=1 Tax=Streptomyces colonosanans TaxID=1428652 RepID=A0A1S2PL64_9ACTN|nr:hypothetical protein [Streptomyces colonosanans]OIJ94125.1 hypothetical protein BIV24_11245 [Streptomyces colonosanans]
MGRFFKDCEHPASRWSKCPHLYKIRYRDAAGKQVEESGFATQDRAIRRLTEIYNTKKAAGRNQAKAERAAKYGAMRFAEYATEWKAGQRDLAPASVRHLGSLLEHHLDEHHRQRHPWETVRRAVTESSAVTPGGVAAGCGPRRWTRWRSGS